MGDDQETSQNPTAKRIKQSISVPFLWEEKPGTPKPGWKRVNPIMQLPVKLIASIPFTWEEKPGTPLISHSKIPTPSSPPPHSRNTNKNPFCDSDSDVLSVFDYHQGIQISEPEMGNGIICSSPKHHMNRNPFFDSSDDELEEAEKLEHDDQMAESKSDNSGYLQAPSSPAWETESFASSCVSGTTLAGSSFLECMFPLLTPKAGFLETVNGGSVNSRVGVPPLTNSCTQIVSYAAERKPLTLGELIMMSRRRTYLQKVVESHQTNHSTELMMRNGFGCCIDVGGLQKLKRQLQLKLI